jgi:hypothetical protein
MIMDNNLSLPLKCAPYVIAAVLTVFELPSRLLAFRYRKFAPPPKVMFAVRWNKVAETVGNPFVVLFIALANVHEMLGRLSDIDAGWWVVGGVIYLTLVLMALWFFAADLQDEHSLPSVHLRQRRILSFDALVAITKAAGVLFPAVLDIWVATSRTASSP